MPFQRDGSRRSSGQLTQEGSVSPRSLALGFAGRQRLGSEGTIPVVPAAQVDRLDPVGGSWRTGSPPAVDIAGGESGAAAHEGAARHRLASEATANAAFLAIEVEADVIHLVAGAPAQ